MKYFDIVLAIIASLTLAQAAPFESIRAVANTLVGGDNKTYNIIELDWNVQINNTSDGPSNRTVTGSIEDVFNYIAQVDPATAAAINNTVNEELAKSNSPAAPSHDLAGLSPQSQPTVHMCNLPQWDTCSAHRAQQGVYYLGTVPGQPGMGPGPGNCGRVSCSYGAAIYWCNDALHDKVLSKYLDIADAAQRVIDYCADKNNYRVQGQQFMTDDWNVIVRYESC